MTAPSSVPSRADVQNAGKRNVIRHGPGDHYVYGETEILEGLARLKTNCAHYDGVRRDTVRGATGVPAVVEFVTDALADLPATTPAVHRRLSLAPSGLSRWTRRSLR